jgi:hypothetical protein
MKRFATALVLFIIVATGCGSSHGRTGSSAAAASGTPSASPALSLTLQGIYDGTMSAAAAVRTQPHLPSGKLILDIMEFGFGVLASNGVVYAQGMHAQGADTVVATVEAPAIPGDTHRLGRLGCTGPGVYRWTYQTTTYNLVFTVVSDTCVDRRLLLAGIHWHSHNAPA